MNKKNTRQKNMKSKLIAAVAMLLVSCIMMVSSTYAWFTLSTAPEVQGITTTVGANGNLEIALLPSSGDVNEITSGIGDANLSWVSKNGTWGNLLDLSDPSYGLGEITLLPSRLNISASDDVTKLPTLSGNALQVPVYGADGRIDTLSGNGVGFGAKNPNANVDGFILNTGSDDDLWGIRAVGTSSTQSETALNFQNALAAISNNRGAANSQINTALATYGSTLATIALKYANGDVDGFEAYMSDINAMLAELEGASDKIEVALYNALLALSISNIPVDAGADGILGNEDDTKISSVTVDLNGTQTKMYDAVKFNLENGISLTTTWGWLGAYASVLEAAFPALYSAYTGWNDINTNVTAARSAFNAINADDGVSVSEIRTVVGYLMNPDYVTINGIAIDAVKDNMGLLFAGGASGINLQLNTGSGIFAYYGQLTGNVSGSVTLPNPTIVQGQNLGGATIMLMTTTEPAAGPLLTQVRSAIALFGVTTDGAQNTASVIDVTYAYALDFVFRTNAANSSLLLQSDAAQRIYGDSQNAATMGAGSTMTFGGTTNGLQTLVDMMSGIRVVFTETSNVGGDVYGIAKVAISQLPMSFAAKTVTAGVDGEGNPTFTEGADTTLDLALTVVPAGANNAMLWSFGAEAIANNVANATVETIVDTMTSTTYLRVKVLPVIPDGADGFKVDDTAEPEYYHIADQVVELTGELCLFNYTVSDAGVLTFGEPMEVQNLTTLGQNIATKITALVYLDGDYIDNSDVVNSENGISNTGRLNLQFASSANLVPMNNSALKDGFGVDANIPTGEGWTFEGAAMTAANTDYVFTVAAPTGDTYTVTYSVDGVDKGELTAQGVGSYKIDAANVTGNIEIFVVETTVTP